MSASEEIREALRNIPVSWLHMPGLAAASAGAPGAKDFGPKIAPAIAALGAAAAGAIVGGGLQLAHQWLDKAKEVPGQYAIPIETVTCSLTIKEIEEAAIRLHEESSRVKDGGALRRIVNTASGGSKALPVLAACFIAGVLAGANAARE